MRVAEGVPAAGDAPAIDPLAEVVALLQPGAPFSKLSSGGGLWRVRREEHGDPFYCVVLDGASRLSVDGHAPVALEKGDFVLVPSIFGFTVENAAGVEDTGVDPTTVTFLDGEARLGDPSAPANVRSLIGHFSFASPDADLLVSLLPKFVHVRAGEGRGETRLEMLGHLVRDEARADRPARDAVLARLLEILLIEALRAVDDNEAAPGLVRGLSDARLAPALRLIHADPARHWTVEALAAEAALSRSAFFERFNRAVGLAPMAYLLSWRMALAKSFLRRGEGDLSDIAIRIGYTSASTFSTAFSRFTGVPPSRYAEAG